GVRELLGKGRKDESGDFTSGAELDPDQTDYIVTLVTANQRGFAVDRGGMDRVNAWNESIKQNAQLTSGFDELTEIERLVRAADFGADRIRVDRSVVRGLEYYTGPVFEAELTFQVKNEDGQTVRFGSVGGGGRYDGLVERFLGTKVPAT